MSRSTNAGRFGYTGQAWLYELGLYYYKARLYSPTLGRFLQTDPVGYDDQINLYAYVGNDPVNRGDPRGTYQCTGTRICPDFRRAQGEAIRTLTGNINKLQQIRKALKSGAEIPDSAQSMVTRMERYIGKGSSQDLATVLRLEARGIRSLGALLSDTRRAIHDPALAPGAGNNRGWGRIYLGERPNAHVVFHESLHESSRASRMGFVSDYPLTVRGKYGEGAARALSEYGPSLTLKNANSLSYAFELGYPDD